MVQAREAPQVDIKYFCQWRGPKRSTNIVSIARDAKVEQDYSLSHEILSSVLDQWSS